MSDVKLPGKPIQFETRHRVRFRDIDAYGHMNMAYYLLYYTDHRFEGMRQFVKMDFKEIEALPIAFHVRSVEIEYLRPLIADQEFVIRSQISEMKRSQCIVDFKLTDLDDQVVSTAKMRIGCISKESLKPCGWPEGVMERYFE